MKPLFSILSSSSASYSTSLSQSGPRIVNSIGNPRCDEKPLTVKLNNPRQEASFVYDNKLLTLKQGMSASGARYSDGIYVFWSKGDSATVYKRDRIVLNNCQLENPKR